MSLQKILSVDMSVFKPLLFGRNGKPLFFKVKISLSEAAKSQLIEGFKGEAEDVRFYTLNESGEKICSGAYNAETMPLHVFEKIDNAAFCEIARTLRHVVNTLHLKSDIVCGVSILRYNRNEVLPDQRVSYVPHRLPDPSLDRREDDRNTQCLMPNLVLYNIISSQTSSLVVYDFQGEKTSQQFIEPLHGVFSNRGFIGKGITKQISKKIWVTLKEKKVLTEDNRVNEKLDLNNSSIDLDLGPRYSTYHDQVLEILRQSKGKENQYSFRKECYDSQYFLFDNQKTAHDLDFVSDGKPQFVVIAHLGVSEVFEYEE